ncbi:MAG: hypothetical protein ABSG03_21460 [Bryobacteraceae bacterium]
MDQKVTRRRMSLTPGGLGGVPAHAQTKKAGTTIHLAGAVMAATWN